MADRTMVMVKETDMISASSLLKLLGESVEGMRRQMKDNPNLTELQKAACGGAIEAITDLHNLVLNQLQDARSAEAFDAAGDGHGGEFDA